MKLLLTTLLATVVLLSTQACGKRSTPAPEEDCHFQQNGYLQRVSWQKLPVTFYADNSLNAGQIESFKEAIEIWNDAFKAEMKGKRAFEFAAALPASIGLKNDFANIVSFTSNWAGDPAEQAETLLLWNNADIVEADIRVNANKPFSLLDIAEIDKIDMVALFVHELGHALGLVHIHTKNEYTAMAEYLSRGDIERRRVGDIELDALKCEY